MSVNAARRSGVRAPRLLQDVGEAEGELERVSLESGRRIVQKRVDDAGGRAYAFVDRERQQSAEEAREGARIVPGRGEGEMLVDY